MFSDVISRVDKYVTTVLLSAFITAGLLLAMESMPQPELASPQTDAPARSPMGRPMVFESTRHQTELVHIKKLFPKEIA